MSHVIPVHIFQTLKCGRWNCNVCGLSRKMTALNYVRLLLGWLPSSLSGLTTAPGAATWPAGALSIGTVKIRPLCNGLELGSGFAFDLAPIAPRGRPHPGDPPRDHTNRRYKLTNPHPHHGTPASTDQRYQHHHPSHQQWTHPGHPHAPPHSYAAAPHPSSYHGPSTQTQPRQQHHAQNQQHHDHP